MLTLVTAPRQTLEVASVTYGKATLLTGPVSVEYRSVTSITHLPNTLHCLLPI